MSDSFVFSGEDESAIRGLVQKMQDGWNEGDGVAFAAPFAEDADYVVVNGTHIRGRKAVAAGHVQIFNTIYRDSHNELKVEQIRPVRPDVAIVHVHAHLTVRVESVMEETDARFTAVAVKTDGKWEFAAFQNTRLWEPRG